MHRLLILTLLAACTAGEDTDTADTADSGDSAETAESGETAETGDSGETADSGDTGETGDTAETGDTSDTADTADTTDTADTADTADTGDTADTADSGDSGDTGPRDADGDGWLDTRDCDDSNPEVYPYAEERCNEVDDDCDGEVDEDVTPTWHEDWDGDSFGDPDSVVLQCEAPEGWVEDGTDCDDSEWDVYPDAPEFCDGEDDDCDGEVDEGVTPTWYRDRDGDTYGNPASTAEDCWQPEGWVADATDCDDSEWDIYPGAPEYCDGEDNNCDGTTDNDALDPATWYADADGDGYGDVTVTDVSCWGGDAWVEDDTDCDDTAASVNPGADEHCDDLDEDCDGAVDEDPVDPGTWYTDADADGYGEPALSTVACDAPEGSVADGTDCDDADATVHPGAEELCDGLDQDCDGGVDGAYRVPADYADVASAVDAAPAGATVCLSPGSYEVPDAVEITRDLKLVGRDGSDATFLYSDTSDRVLTGNTVDLELQGLHIAWGQTSSNGGCMRFWDSDVVMEDVQVEICTGGQVGGGFYATDTNVELYDAYFGENFAGDGTAGYGGGFAVSNGNVTASQLMVIGNYTEGPWGCGAAGFGVYGEMSAYTLDLTNTVVAWNMCWHDGSFGILEGAGIYSQANLVYMENVTIADNELYSSSMDTEGVGYYQSGSWLWMNNVAVVNNRGDASSSALAMYGVPATITYSNVYGNDGAAYGGDATDPTGTDGNISVAPDFLRESGSDPSYVNMRLNATSGMVDAGDPAILDADGTRSDVGGYGGPGGAW